MTRIIGIVSGKGGVGKTTTTINLAAALAQVGHDVIAVDANLTTPHMGLQTGLHLVPSTLHDVLRGTSRVQNALYPHTLGFRIMPGSLGIKDLEGVDIGRLPELTDNLNGKADYVLLDCAPALGREAISALDAVDEIILIANPDLPSITDVMKTAKVAQDMDKNILGIVVNRVRGRSHELSKDHIEDILGLPVISEIPEDRNIARSIAEKMPIIGHAPSSPASVEFRRLAHTIAGKEFNYTPRNLTILERMVGWLTA